MGLRTWLGLKVKPAPVRSQSIDEAQVQPSFPIDLVYTWVDGGDPEFQRQRQACLGRSESPAAVGSERWRDHDELRFSLRSVAAYAPWVRHVYVVTNGQRPLWLADHPRISIITHEQILEPRHLPTFNSHVIESALHHIPGLSEHYIYLNDDILFLRPVEPSDFFTGNGLAYGYLSAASLPDAAPSSDDLPSLAAARNSVALIHREWGVWLNRRFKHAAYPQRKSVCEEAEKRFEKEVEICRSNRFRAHNDVVFCTYLATNVAYMTAKGLLRRNRTMYINIHERHAVDAYRQALQNRDNGYAYASDTVCLNDATGLQPTSPDYRERLRQFLQAYFPEPSVFESRTGAESRAA